MSDVLEFVKAFRLVIPIDRLIHVADDVRFTGTDLACLAKLVSAANAGGLKGHKLKSLRVKPRNDTGDIQFEFDWEDPISAT